MASPRCPAPATAIPRSASCRTSAGEDTASAAASSGVASPVGIGAAVAPARSTPSSAAIASADGSARSATTCPGRTPAPRTAARHRVAPAIQSSAHVVVPVASTTAGASPASARACPDQPLGRPPGHQPAPDRLDPEPRHRPLVDRDPQPPGRGPARDPHPSLLDGQAIDQEVVLQEPRGGEPVIGRPLEPSRRPSGSAAATASPAAIPIPVSNSVLTTTGTPRSGGEGRDLRRGHRAADACRLHDQHVDRLGVEQRPRRPQGGDRLVGRDGDADAPPELGQVGRVVARQGLLDVLDARTGRSPPAGPSRSRGPRRRSRRAGGGRRAPPPTGRRAPGPPAPRSRAPRRPSA